MRTAGNAQLHGITEVRPSSGTATRGSPVTADIFKTLALGSPLRPRMGAPRI
ncbi:MAG: hypothetical protein WCK27_18570 [Verrucomicrobiota bacterium]